MENSSGGITPSLGEKFKKKYYIGYHKEHQQ
jgi:hypothetical protein